MTGLNPSAPAARPRAARRTVPERLRRVLAAVLLLSLPGCFPRELHGPIPCLRELCRENMTVAVAAFRDDRPPEEFGSPPPRPEPVARDLVEDMPTELARHLIGRFNAEAFFLQATLVEASGSPPQPEFLARLAADGYDGVITGNVPRCLGTTCVTGGDLAGYLLLRVVGTVFQVLLPMPFGYYHNEGILTVNDLRLTDTRSGEVVWRGDFTKEVVNYTGDPSPGAAIREAMHAVTEAILEDLRESLRSGRQGGPVPEEP